VLRKRHQYRILTAAFLFALVGVAFFAGGMGARLQKPQDYSSQQPSKDESYWQQKPESFWQRLTADPIAIITLALVIVNGAMACAIFRQIQLARDEFNATHRPIMQLRRLFVFSPLTDSPEHSADTEIRFSIFNEGPAYHRHSATI
jgi:hypothetical protein